MSNSQKIGCFALHRGKPICLVVSIQNAFHFLIPKMCTPNRRLLSLKELSSNFILSSVNDQDLCSKNRKVSLRTKEKSMETRNCYIIIFYENISSRRKHLPPSLPTIFFLLRTQKGAYQKNNPEALDSTVLKRESSEGTPESHDLFVFDIWIFTSCLSSNNFFKKMSLKFFNSVTLKCFLLLVLTLF